jgi:membrane-bound lytic murein transglycosylase B
MLLVMLAVGGTGVLAGRLFAASTPAVSAPPAASSNSGAGLGGTPSPVTTIGGRARPADALATWAERVSQATAMPLVAAQAYGHAQLVLAADAPQCHLGWTTLAGIGEAASRHGQAYGASLGADGRSSRPSIGSQLDEAGRPRPDTDTGRLDGDPTADRPVGPMQLLPAQWNRYASDGDLDGVSDPYDIDDASLATARLLCDSGADLSQPEQWGQRLLPRSLRRRRWLRRPDRLGGLIRTGLASVHRHRIVT